MSPTSTVTGYTISDLPGVQVVATEVPGSLFELEVPTGPVANGYTNKKLTEAQLIEYLQSQFATTGLRTLGYRYNPPANNTYTFGSTDFNTCVRLDVSADSTIVLPALTAANAGVVIAFLQVDAAGGPYTSTVQGEFGLGAPAGATTIQNGQRVAFVALAFNNQIGWVKIGHVGQGGGLPSGTVIHDPYNVPAAKRIQVVNAAAPAVAETDSTYYDCQFVDEVYGPDAPAHYKCMPSAPATTGGATTWKWFRFAIV